MPLPPGMYETPRDRASVLAMSTAASILRSSTRPGPCSCRDLEIRRAAWKEREVKRGGEEGGE